MSLAILPQICLTPCTPLGDWPEPTGRPGCQAQASVLEDSGTRSGGRGRGILAGYAVRKTGRQHGIWHNRAFSGPLRSLPYINPGWQVQEPAPCSSGAKFPKTAFSARWAPLKLLPEAH
ncbi:mCG59558 [Mus musculus]|nr:mCG59558 [Mus musculus]